MLTFDSALTNALKNSNTTAFWVLKLYYNHESAFIGVSDRHRHDGSDIYYDMGKLWHSFHGKYDLIHSDFSELKKSEMLFNISPPSKS